MSTLNDVNTTSIEKAIRLGCRTMQNVFDADDHQAPYFNSIVKPHAALQFSVASSDAHVPGRHLNALLNAEDAIDVELDETAVGHHRRAAFLSYSGPLDLPLNRPSKTAPPTNFCPHNLREGFHALYALAMHRNDAEACEIAERSIADIFKYWSPDNGWDVAGLSALGLNYQKCQGFLHGEARALGPLVKYYRATRCRPALDLALVFNEKLATYFTAEGDFDADRFGTRHIHSITCVLSSLAQLADLLQDMALLSRVKAFYDNGLQCMRDELGWSPETTTQTGTDHGEANNTGDILETALILGRWGYSDCYHDAERILRGHLLPSQLRDVSFIDDPPNPDDVDGLRNVADRHLGAFGFPAPYGHESVGEGRQGQISFNMDILGGTVASLCEAYREVARTESVGTRINMLFDHESPAVRVESPHTHDLLRVELRHSGPLFIRVPPWVDRTELTVQGSATSPTWSGDYLYFNELASGQMVELRFGLVETEITLSERMHIQPIRVGMRGDAVTAMESFGAELTFFEPYD
jgi:hypothetical protein